MPEQLVIIGGNAAGLAAALAARRRCPDLRILVLEAGTDFSFGSCGMPYNLADPSRVPEDLLVRPASSFQALGIQLAPGHRVEAVDLRKGRLRVERRVPGGPGERLELPWDRLVAACGAVSRELVIPGLPAAALLSFKSLEDLRGLKRRLPGLRRVAVLGAGPLGLELCEGLVARGLRVLLVEPQALPLAGFPGDLRRRVLQELETQGLDLALGCLVRSAQETGSSGVELELARVDQPDGPTSREKVDLLLHAAGQRPATDCLHELRRDERGTLPVDLHMRTSHARVWAAGDCVARPSCVPARAGEATWVWHPQAREALRGGRVAGWNAAAGDEDRLLPAGPQTLVVKCFALEIARCGRLSTDDATALPPSAPPQTPVVRGLLGQPAPALSGPAPRPSVAGVLRARSDSRTLGHALPGSGQLQVWLEADAEGRLRGGALLSESPGAALRVNVLAALLQQGGSAADLAVLDLAYSPPFGPLVDPLIQAAERLMRH